MPLVMIVWQYVRSIMLGGVAALFVTILYAILHLRHRGIIGTDPLRFELTHSLMYWVVVLAAFGVTTFYSLRP